MSTLHTLSRASGSATYVSPRPLRSTYQQTQAPSQSSAPLTITCGVNFPLEVPRRSDEIPDALLIEVNIRPARGVGQVRERHLEELVKRTLGTIIFKEDWPRQVCQVGLQVMTGGQEVEVEEGGQNVRYLGYLPGCVNAAVMGCLDAAVPMKTVLGAVMIGVTKSGDILGQPDAWERSICESLHVFGFTANGKLVLAESEGRFTVDEWEQGQALGQRMVIGQEAEEGDAIMNGNQEGLEGGSLINMLRQTIEARVARDERWNEG